jgi:hypothetical protein
MMQDKIDSGFKFSITKSKSKLYTFTVLKVGKVLHGNLWLTFSDVLVKENYLKLPEAQAMLKKFKQDINLA